MTSDEYTHHHAAFVFEQSASGTASGSGRRVSDCMTCVRARELVEVVNLALL